MLRTPAVAYFSAEFGLSDRIPIFAGGLGVLAGDVLREAADSNFPLIGVTLFYHHGFFRQVIGKDGCQQGEFFVLNPHEVGLQEVLDPQTGKPLIIELNFPQEPVKLRVWQKSIPPTFAGRYDDEGLSGNSPVTLYFLDAALPENKPFEVEYTGRLYEGDWAPKLHTEIVLGVGGARLLTRLGIVPRVWQLNDDHAALLFLERLRKESLDQIKKTTVFTTHTPVPGAVSLFPIKKMRVYLESLFKGKLGDAEIGQMLELGRDGEGNFNFTLLSLRISRRISGVSQRHARIARRIWADALEEKEIIALTNGVHAPTWVSEPMNNFYRKWLGSRYLQEISQPKTWEKLLRAGDTGLGEVTDFYRDLWDARWQCKQELINRLPNLLPSSLVRKGTALSLSPEALFLGFARRFAPYKQADVLIWDLERLIRLLTDPQRPVYLFVSGKAHYIDPVGQEILARLVKAGQDPRLRGHLFFLENYGLEIAKVLVSGVDLWINTPQVPMEASGTSGMKALYNGVLNCSVADGWWWEVVNRDKVGDGKWHTLAKTNGKARKLKLGFTIGPLNPSLTSPPTKEETAQNLYAVLENEIVPLYYQREGKIPVKWLELVKESWVALAFYFNTQRMLSEYRSRLWEENTFS